MKDRNWTGFTGSAGWGSSHPVHRVNPVKRFVSPVRLCASAVNVRRGSTLLLVLAALLLSLILGMTYLEIVRLDRKATKNILTAGDLDTVIQSVEGLIATRLVDDLGIDTNGNFFALGDGDGTPGTTPAEPYDYPGSKDRWLSSTAAA